MTAVRDVGDGVRKVAAVRTRGLNRVRLVTLVLLVMLAALFITALAVGSVFISPGNVLGALFGEAPRRATYIVNEVRLPRALTGALAGLAFGLSGGVFQNLVRNPLASPDVIGITMGASAAAVVCILGLGLTGVAVSGGAFIGALATASLIYVLAWRRGVTGYRLVLVGIGIAAVLSSVVSYMITRADVKDAQQALTWLTGSLTARTWIDVTPVAIILAVVAPLVLVLAQSLKAIQFGDDVATGLGVAVERRRLGLILCGVALAAAATAAAGPVAFVAFVSGPIARRLIRGHTSALVPSALVGAVVLIGSDLVAQHLLGNTVLPVGVVTGVLGAPYLLWLMATRSGRAG
nr:iron chelate uptake ABC transporter family permease subunit [Kibdelosporangium sp. MJ126-NF4]CEL19992.1 ABC-type Fe3+-siderophore transport system, permease 2 component [Kibdelosporangium sp. MJ126-NF4]CTQ97216.1 ABC-type Fe3+-siderophore transport system, permease 2 component [Kibdelosporangium sp. MJ126-NF4]